MLLNFNLFLQKNMQKFQKQLPRVGSNHQPFG